MKVIKESEGGKKMRRLGQTIVVHDGTASSLAQGLALAKRFEAPVLEVGVPPDILQALPTFASIAVGKASSWRCSPPVLQLANSLVESTLMHDAENQNLIIGCGRRTAPLCVAVKDVFNADHRKRAINVQILNPRCGMFKERWFDTIITPMHDGLQGKNVFQTIGSLTWVDPAAIKAWKDTILKQYANNRSHPFLGNLHQLKETRLMVLLGGDTPRKKADSALVMNQLTTILAESKSLFTKVFVVGSRRTPEKLLLDVQEKLGLPVWVPPHVWKSRRTVREEIANPYKDCLAFGDAFIVTGDSVSIACDACSTGKAVKLLYQGFDGEQPGTKLFKFQELLSQQNVLVDRFTEQSLQRKYTQLQDAKRAAQYIEDRFFASPSSPSS